jgi:hypothetical protein
VAQNSPNALSGRRGNWRYLYGSHGWVPLIDANWSKGIVRDAPRSSIPPGGVYDSFDFLLHQPGVAIKRGGTSYAGPAFASGTSAKAVAYAEFPAAPQLIAVGSDNHIHKVTAGASTYLAGTSVAGGIIDRPKLRIGGGANLLIFPCADGTTAPVAYAGSGTPAVLGGTPPAGKVCEIYKTRLVLGGASAQPQRLYFSPTPDIASTWDTTDSWIDCDHAVTGIAALHNALLIFSQGHTERIIGSTPPPGSDMDRSPLGDVGCSDARSIIVQEGNCLFANSRGVYLTNGAGFASLTTEGQIETYWQSLLEGYDPATWTISAGIIRSFYVVSIMDNNGSNVATLMCNVPRRAWWRLTNINAQMFSQAVGAQEELYYADQSVPRITTMSGIFKPTAGNRYDADSTPVEPGIDFQTQAGGPGLKSYGDGRLSFDMRDAATDNPTMAVNYAKGLEATTYQGANQSPFSETTDENRLTFSTGFDSQAISLQLRQTGPSSKTEVFAIEVDERTHSLTKGGA